MSDLTDFILARVDEEEQIAELACNSEWFKEDNLATAVRENYGQLTAGYFGRWHPRRVLNECKDKRFTVARYGESDIPLMKSLADVWADHTLYNPAWADINAG